MSGLSTRQRTMTRTRVNPSSITLNFDSFPFVPDLPAPGMRIFFCFGKARPEDEGKPETENTLLSKEEDCLSPLPERFGLPHRRASIDLQKRIYANTRGRTNGRNSSALCALRMEKDPPRRIDSGAAQKSKRERRTRSPAGY